MNTVPRLLALAAVLLAGCESASLEPIGEPDTVQRGVVVKENGTPFQWNVSRCTGGEFLLVEGGYHVTITSDSVRAGFDRTYGYHFVARGTATDPVTGTRYQYIANQNLHWKQRADSSTHTETFRLHTRLIAQGKEPNLDMTLLLHMTADKDGTWSSYIDEVRLTCGPPESPSLSIDSVANASAASVEPGATVTGDVTVNLRLSTGARANLDSVKVQLGDTQVCGHYFVPPYRPTTGYLLVSCTFNTAQVTSGGAALTSGGTYVLSAALFADASNAPVATATFGTVTLGGADLTPPSLLVSVGADSATLHVTVTDEGSGPSYISFRIEGYSVLEVDSDLGVEVRCYNEAGGLVGCVDPDSALLDVSGNTGTYTLHPPSAQNFYVMTLRAVDAAGNVSSPAYSRSALVDTAAPTAVVNSYTIVYADGVSVSGVARDNIDVSAYDVRFGFQAHSNAELRVVPFRPRTPVSSWGLPLAGAVAITEANAPFVRQLDGAAMSEIGIGVHDAAGNFGYSPIVFGGVPGDGIAGMVAPFDMWLSSDTIEAADAVTATADVTVDPGGANPVSSVWFYAWHPAGHLVLIGTDTSASVIPGATTLRFRYSAPLSAWGLELQAGSSRHIYAIALDAQGDGVSAQATLVIRP